MLKSKNVSGSNVYTLNNGEFVKRTASSGTVAANTAYYTSDSEAASIVLHKGEVTSIGSIVAGDGQLKFYDLKGNRVEKPVRGIYVTSEGQKVLVK